MKANQLRAWNMVGLSAVFEAVEVWGSIRFVQTRMKRT